MKKFSVLFSYRTTDPYYRGHRATVVRAADEASARLQVKIMRGYNDISILRIKEIV